MQNVGLSVVVKLCMRVKSHFIVYGLNMHSKLEKMHQNSYSELSKEMPEAECVPIKVVSMPIAC